MEAITGILEQSIKAGFINKAIHANQDYLPELLVNNKSSEKKVLSTISRQLRECDEFLFSVAFVTMSGVATLINVLDELRDKKVCGKILVSQYLNFSEPEALKKLLAFDNIELKIVVVGDFHSKGYFFRKNEMYNIIIGSSNLTASALCTNKELNLMVSALSTSDIVFNALSEFTPEFNSATVVDEAFITAYEEHYLKQRAQSENFSLFQSSPLKITPNAMQVKALAQIEEIRKEGKTKALLISATGTGKTYLSAFDVKKANPKKFLFIVHRLNIAKAAMKTFEVIFGDERTYGVFSGQQKEIDKDFIFSTVQTISKEENLRFFSKKHFDYIVIDETHRAGAESYQRILSYFEPKFTLGMTATPERTDGYDVFALFDHTIAYEIRLHQALEENMLCPFHYYGVTDVMVDGQELDDHSEFSLLTSDERIKHIINRIEFYGCDTGEVRGLVFCSSIKECKELSIQFRQHGYKTIALTGANSEKERSDAIHCLESDNASNKIDYIFTVDVFNEGVDIPSINQIIMLRPTQSAIIFVQQLGRGLRKTMNKNYLTVVDFIANYNNSYLVPIALYGDTSYNKDSLRKLISSESNSIPGESTINFDKISKDRIFSAINSANMQLKRDLVSDYSLLKFKLGRIPMMMDFIKHGSREPKLYANYSRSYFNFVQTQECELKGCLTEKEIKVLELFSKEINNAKRAEESLILKAIINQGRVSFESIKDLISSSFNYEVSHATLISCIKNVNFEFIRENKAGQLKSVCEIYGLDIAHIDGEYVIASEYFRSMLKNELFKEFLLDNIEYSIFTFDKLFVEGHFFDGFVLYRKYSRKDVFRILNWNENPVAQNVGGYIIKKPNKENCPVFVNYHKDENIVSTIKYEDRFLNNSEFEWMSKSRRTLKSPDVQAILNESNMRLPLFIKKSNDEGDEFYYMGDIKPVLDSAVETSLPNDDGTSVSVVRICFDVSPPVSHAMYDYITSQGY